MMADRMRARSGCDSVDLRVNFSRYKCFLIDVTEPKVSETNPSGAAPLPRLHAPSIFSWAEPVKSQTNMRKSLTIVFSLLVVSVLLLTAFAGGPVFWRVNTRAEIEKGDAQ